MEIVSIAVPPFPIFIEGNLTTFERGTSHPDRSDLEYFDLIFVKKGILYMTEDEKPFTIDPNEMLVLLPMKHHYSTKPVDEETEFYWLHFYTNSYYSEGDGPRKLASSIPIPSLHFHNHSYTLRLQKHCKLVDDEEIYKKIDQLLLATTNANKELSFWDIQIHFFSLINVLEYQGMAKDTGYILSEKIARYIRDHYHQPITSTTLAEQFNVHENTIAKYMKKFYKVTALEYLNTYRLEQSRILLLKTDDPIQSIAEQCGFSVGPYFSSAFKKTYGMSPLNYRKKHLRDLKRGDGSRVSLLR
ncbi:AraC family transcriptional regulator [Pullulanibacillus sp. KACC 23026]|uniref:helix-turn-helix transcriptional regulator n=1 Tax=Pullulanibacillus sp. KACC 23026 TaxID=3028315 RepID=UPI0023B18F1B|nr:AraC family transcriptional regulator [Pullulanibacillus sp. KACC 23026]WEG11185.1 AraC family transcriptional regulator [Pullulanibacillus sp. KACC 23026]